MGRFIPTYSVIHSLESFIWQRYVFTGFSATKNFSPQAGLLVNFSHFSKNLGSSKITLVLDLRPWHLCNTTLWVMGWFLTFMLTMWFWNICNGVGMVKFNDFTRTWPKKDIENSKCWNSESSFWFVDSFSKTSVASIHPIEEKQNINPVMQIHEIFVTKIRKN